MNKHKQVGSCVLPCILLLVAPHVTFAQSLSAALGATKLDGLKNYNECQNQSVGYQDHLIADRLEAKLAKATALSAEERAVWAADIGALRAVAPGKPYKAADPKNPQRYFMALTDAEWAAITSMNTRFVQEINLACEHKYGGMSRFSPGSDQSAQLRYEQQLRDKMQEPTDIATIPVEPIPSPFPKTAAQVAAEQQAAQDASKNAMMQKFTSCTDASKGLRLSIMADHMQHALDSAQGLSSQERADFEADIKATRDSAAKGLEQVEPVDPSNPYRAMMRLSSQDQIAVAMEFSQKYTESMAACTRR
jgi:hypothetical protein